MEESNSILIQQNEPLPEEIRQGQPVKKPQVGRRCPQTALRWCAGNVLRHKAEGLRPYNPGRRQCLLLLHFFDTLPLPEEIRQGFSYSFEESVSPY